MRNLKEKLKSSLGASMIIAMVFMLICVFVGGSILAAATANSYRLKFQAQQNEVLAQRSAAALISDVLKTDDHSPLILKINDYRQKTEPVKIKNDGTVENHGAASNMHIVEFTFSDDASLNSLQRIIIHAAIYNYMDTIMDPAVDYVVNGISVPNLANDYLMIERDLSGALQAELNIQPSITGSAEVLPVTKAKMIFSGNYDSVVDFSQTAAVGGIPNHVQIRLDAAKGVRTIPDVEIITRTNPSRDDGIRVTTTKNQITSVVWNNPQVVKGAA